MFRRVENNMKDNLNKDEKENEVKEDNTKSQVVQEEGASGGHCHDNVNDFHHDCPQCKKEEGHFVEVQMEDDKSNQRCMEKIEREKKKSKSYKWYDSLRKKRNKGELKCEVEMLCKEDSSEESTLFNVENVGRRRSTSADNRRERD